MARGVRVEEQRPEVELRRDEAKETTNRHDRQAEDRLAGNRRLFVDLRPEIREEHARAKHHRPGEHGSLDQDHDLREPRREHEERHEDQIHHRGRGDGDDRRVIFLRDRCERRRSYPVEGPGDDGPDAECVHGRDPHPHPKEQPKRREHRDQRRLGENAGEKRHGWVSRRGEAAIGGEHVEYRRTEELEAEHFIGEPDRDDPRHRGDQHRAQHADGLRLADRFDFAADGDGKGRADQRQERPVGHEDGLPEIGPCFTPALLLAAGDDCIVGVRHAERRANQLV